MSLLSRFCFFSTILRLLFINPQRLHHKCPREQLRQGSQFTVRGQQAGIEDRARLFKSPRRGRKPCPLWPSLPPKEVSVCAVLTSCQPPGKGLLCCLGVRVSQCFLTLKAETKQVPRHAIQFT